jgi:PAS domain S-box-containing protein
LAHRPRIAYRPFVDIRTKLVFALVGLTLGSMLAFGAFMYRTAHEMIDDATAQQLEGLAESSTDALESIVDGWQERVQLVASRTQLRINLREFNATGDPAARAGIKRILDDATGSVRTIAALATYGRGGRLVAQSGGNADSILSVLYPTSRAESTERVRFLGVSFTPDGIPRVAYGTRLTIDGERVGFLFVLLNASRIVDLTADTAGLGQTGELMIVAPDPEGARTLHPVRGGDPTDQGGILLSGERDPAILAFDGQTGLFQEGLVDYRGEVVWAATRYVSKTGWVLVVKFDEDEKRGAIYRFREEMVSLALTLAGIGLFVAVILGFRFATPIHSLAEVAKRIGEGDMDARATVKREDEIGLLASTLNQMADELEERVTELHEFQKFFEVSINLLCIAGTDGYFKRTNPAFQEALGWDQETLLGHPFLELVHPDDAKATENEIQKLAQGIPTISFVNRFRCADGSWKWLRWTSYPEPETGLLYAIAREIEGPQDT